MKPLLPIVAGLALSASVLGQHVNQQTHYEPPSLKRWGVSLLPFALRLTHLDVDTMTVSTPIDVPTPSGLSGQLHTSHVLVAPAVSEDDFSAAVAVELVDPGVTYPGPAREAVYVLRNIRKPSASQATGYWLPLIDPDETNYQYCIVGSARFLNSNELWVIEVRQPSSAVSYYRLARYQLGATSAAFLGASDLDAPSNTYLPTSSWVIDAGQAVFLQQTGAQGLELARYTTGGNLASSLPVELHGYAVHNASFAGIDPVPAHHWVFAQYGTDLNGACHARFIDLASGLMTAELPVGTRHGCISTNGELALFEDVYGTNGRLIPVHLPRVIAGQPLDQLPSVNSFFCGDGSRAADGGDIITVNTCTATVHRTRLDAAGQLDVTDISTNTGHGAPFGLNPGFRYPGLNRIYSSTGLLQMLEVTPMTYGPQTVFMPVLWFF